MRRAIAACDEEVSERVLRLGLKVRWEIGEAGAGGGWKAGEVMDTSSFQLVSARISNTIQMGAAHACSVLASARH